MRHTYCFIWMPNSKVDSEAGVEKHVIEFKGAYYRKRHGVPLSVLVQFDGVVLHVWHMSDPFHRLLTSDVFRLPLAMGKRNRCIKLPNGGRIETDDLNALGTLQSNTCSSLIRQEKILPYLKFVAAGAVLLLLVGACLIAKYMLAT